MMSCDFQTTTHGKWILAGEHAVVRGHPALVFPLSEKQLTLSYVRSPLTLSADYEGETGADMQLLFWSVLEQGLQQLGHSINRLKGKFHLLSNIPIGAGMGASAALCVAVSRWFISQDLLDESQLYLFAKTLENLFHGQSSGLDIAGVASEKGVYFHQGHCEPLQQTWAPQWYLSSCSQIGMTSHCIQQVNNLWSSNPEQAAKLDEQMAASVAKARTALSVALPSAHQQLAQAMTQAADCFRQWGLISENLHHHMSQLFAQGAIAAKPTGSGGGGYIISLWDKEPPLKTQEFIAV